MQKLGYYQYLCSRLWNIWRTEGTATLLAKINSHYFDRHRAIKLDDLEHPPPGNLALPGAPAPVPPSYREKGLLVINNYRAYRYCQAASAGLTTAATEAEKIILFSFLQDQVAIAQVIETLQRQEHQNWHLYLTESNTAEQNRPAAASPGDPRIERLTLKDEMPAAVINQIIKKSGVKYYAYLAAKLPPENDLFSIFLSEFSRDPALEAIHCYGGKYCLALSLHRLASFSCLEAINS